eukprot:m.81673 g.81673  ORF g.81673 m.81673 type:complete len:82 (+) comp14700_c0_seq4:1552-1797(+)
MAADHPGLTHRESETTVGQSVTKACLCLSACGNEFVNLCLCVCVCGCNKVVAIFIDCLLVRWWWFLQLCSSDHLLSTTAAM